MTAHVPPLSPAQLKAWMQAAGMDSWVDAIGNVHGRVEGSLPGPATFTGSHYDTVVDGGKYDGALGIIAGIAAVKALVLEVCVYVCWGFGGGAGERASSCAA